MKTTMFGISGYARSGKDSFAKALQTILRAENITPPTASFAGLLKTKINTFLIQNAGISAWTRDDREKLIIRPMLVAYGAMMRAIDENYWVDAIAPSLQVAISEDHFPIVTDVRYTNEAKMIKELGGKILVIKREGNTAANQEEEKNQPGVELIADEVISFFNTEKFEEEHLTSARNILEKYKIV